MSTRFVRTPSRHSMLTNTAISLTFRCCYTFVRTFILVLSLIDHVTSIGKTVGNGRCYQRDVECGSWRDKKTDTKRSLHVKVFILSLSLSPPLFFSPSLSFSCLSLISFLSHLLFLFYILYRNARHPSILYFIRNICVCACVVCGKLFCFTTWFCFLNFDTRYCDLHGHLQRREWFVYYNRTCSWRRLKTMAKATGTTIDTCGTSAATHYISPACQHTSHVLKIGTVMDTTPEDCYGCSSCYVVCEYVIYDKTG